MCRETQTIKADLAIACTRLKHLNEQIPGDKVNILQVEQQIQHLEAELALAMQRPTIPTPAPTQTPAFQEPDRTFRYDAFISYSHRDEAWVQQWLLPRLEAAGFCVCIDFRDFEPGAPSLTEMERAVLESRKTLLILTPNYVNSEWTEFENILAQMLDPASRRRRLLPLLLKPCALPLRIRTLNYLDFTRPEMIDLQLSRLVTSLKAMPEVGLIVNAGFENGFIGWTEDPAQLQYGGQSREDATEAHSGQRSRKLFLRSGGSHIIQTIPVQLPAGTRITLKAWVKMPFPGSQSNKWFTMDLVAAGADGQRDSPLSCQQTEALPTWTQLSVRPFVASFPVTQLEIHAKTTNGDGSYQGFDQPVWVDDFELDIQMATTGATATMVADLTTVDSTKLRRAMRSAYDRPAFEILCKDMGLDYDDLRGETLETKMLYRIDHFQRHRQYEKLVQKVLADHSYLADELW